MADDAYDVTTDIGTVRFYIPDTHPIPQPQLPAGTTAFMFSDDELQMLLDRNAGSVLLAAADACMVFGTNEMMIGKVITTQDQVTDTSKLMAQYRANAEALRAQATAMGQGPTGDLVGAGIDVVTVNAQPLYTWSGCLGCPPPRWAF